MNLYSNKQRWKLVLFAFAILIVVISLWYTSEIVKKIRAEERQKVRLWADAIRNRADLVHYTAQLFDQLRDGERQKVELMAEATQVLADGNNIQDYTFVLKVLQNNTTVPVIISDANGNVSQTRNLNPEFEDDSAYIAQQIEIMRNTYPPIQLGNATGKTELLYYKDSKLFIELQRFLDDLIQSFILESVINSASVPVIYTDSTKVNVLNYGNIDSLIIADTFKTKEKILEMIEENEPIKIDLGNESINYIFYEDSYTLTQLKYYPFVQLIIIGLFLLISYVLFSTFRKAEQNQVWVGMAKETAHQLGTPLSSLMAWMDLLETRGIDTATIDEMNKDVQRLKCITDRFSKIGAEPELKLQSVSSRVNATVNYLKPRVSSKVSFEVQQVGDFIKARLNKPLFEWVIENLCKNAIDSMAGDGKIKITIRDCENLVSISISDSGKGISPSKYKRVFQPGFTTKKRGWGLGLTLVKRIVENYHKGRIYVTQPEFNSGATFKIELRK